MVRIPGGIGSIMTVRTGLVGAGAIVGIGRGRNELQRVREAPIRAFGATCFLRKGAVRGGIGCIGGIARFGGRSNGSMDSSCCGVPGSEKRKGDEKLPGKAPESGKMNAYQHRAENRSRPHRPHRSYRWPRSCSCLTKQGPSGFFLRPLVSLKICRLLLTPFRCFFLSGFEFSFFFIMVFCEFLWSKFFLSIYMASRKSR